MTFLVVEQKEPHAGRMAFEDIKQPATFAERCALAERMRDELEVTMPIYVDGMDDASRALFSDLPSPAFVIDREGRIADKLPWADPEPLGNAITRVLRDEKPTRWPDANPLAFEERDAAMRRAVLAEDQFLRIRWSNDEVAQTLDANAPAIEKARRAMTRAWLFSGRKKSDRLAAIAAIAPAIEAAWTKDPMRLLAARVEFAELLASRWDGSGWATLAASPPASADERVRTWIQAQHTAFEEPLLAFDEATRARVRQQLMDLRPSGHDALFRSNLALVRVRFTKEGMYVVRSAERIGLREGERLVLEGRQDGDPIPLTEGERNVLVMRLIMVSQSRMTRLLAIAEK